MTRTEFIHNAMVASFAASDTDTEACIKEANRAADMLGLKDLPMGDGVDAKTVPHEDWKGIAEELAKDLRLHRDGHIVGSKERASDESEEARA